MANRYRIVFTRRAYRQFEAFQRMNATRLRKIARRSLWIKSRDSFDRYGISISAFSMLCNRAAAPNGDEVNAALAQLVQDRIGREFAVEVEPGGVEARERMPVLVTVHGG